MNKSTKHNRQDLNRAILSGVDTHLKGQIIVLQGVSYKQSQLRQLFQDDLDATSATSNARAQWQSAVVSERATAAKTHAVKNALFAYLSATYGPTSQVLIDFGSAPKKAPKTAPGVKALAVEQAKATRGARHVMGRRQRARIKPVVMVQGAAVATTATPVTTAPVVTTPQAQPQAPAQPLATAPAAVTTPSAGGANGANGAAPTNGAGVTALRA